MQQMRFEMLKQLRIVAATCALIMSAPAFADSTVVDISAYDAGRPDGVPLPVIKTFGPGTYTASVVGKAGGGAFDAWGVATPANGNWNDEYNISYDNTTTTVNPYNSQRFATATDALAAFASVLTTFTLDKVTDVSFSIPDYLFVDNVGGVSVGISSGSPAAVPEPATMALFGLGSAMLLAGRRRKKAANA